MTDTLVLEKLKKYGKEPISYSVLQEGLQYLQTSMGMAAFEKRGRDFFVLGDPICDSTSVHSLLNETVRQLKNPMFAQMFENFFLLTRKRMKLLDLLFLIPCFMDSKVIGYCADFMRARRNAPKGHVAFMILKAMEIFKEEGIETLSCKRKQF